MASNEDYVSMLEKQVQSSVYLEDSIKYMEEQGVWAQMLSERSFGGKAFFGIVDRGIAGPGAGHFLIINAVETVEAVAQNREPEFREMSPNLMFAARQEFRFNH